MMSMIPYFISRIISKYNQKEIGFAFYSTIHKVTTLFYCVRINSEMKEERIVFFFC